MNNQRGGILSKLFFLPIGIALMIGFFFLGYYVGRYQSRSAKINEPLPQLPETVAKHIPKKEDFTFYKTLTEKDNITVSIDLKPKSSSQDNREGQTPKEPAKKEDALSGNQQKPAEKKKEGRTIEVKLDKAPSQPPRQEKPEPPRKSEPSPQPKKEQATALDAAGTLRYTIQVASYPARDMAEEDVKRMKKRGYAAFVKENEIPEKGTWYRVRVGSFKNRASAERLAGELKSKEGLDPFITVE
jgi:cell division septation protein DedD